MAEKHSKAYLNQIREIKRRQKAEAKAKKAEEARLKKIRAKEERVAKLERDRRLHAAKADIEAEKARRRKAKYAARPKRGKSSSILNPVGGKRIGKKGKPWYDRVG